MPSKIYIIRHGETDYNLERRMQGWLDIPLNSRGVEQALAAASKIATHQIDHLYSSDLLRAHQTAECIASTISIKITTTPALRERDMGIFAGWAWEKEPDAEKEKIWKEFESNRDLGNDNWNLHKGESMRDMTTRVSKFMDEVHLNHKDQVVALVTHGGTINRLLEYYSLKSPKEGFRMIRNASVLVLSKTDHTYTMEEI